MTALVYKQTATEESNADNSLPTTTFLSYMTDSNNDLTDAIDSLHKHIVVYDRSNIDSIVSAAVLLSHMRQSNDKLAVAADIPLLNKCTNATYYWVGVTPDCVNIKDVQKEKHVVFSLSEVPKTIREKVDKSYVWEDDICEVGKALWSVYADNVPPRTLLGLVFSKIGGSQEVMNNAKIMDLVHAFRYERRMNLKDQQLLWSIVDESKKVLDTVDTSCKINLNKTAYDETLYIDFLKKVKREVSASVEFHATSINGYKLFIPMVNISVEMAPWAARLILQTYRTAVLYRCQRHKLIFSIHGDYGISSVVMERLKQRNEVFSDRPAVFIISV